MLFRWWKEKGQSAEHPTASAALTAHVRATLPQADGDTIALVAAVAGLLATVAYADRAYHEEEQRAVHDALARVHGLSAETAAAIESLLASRAGELAGEDLHEYSRVLVELTERDARVELLDMLMDLAAADLVVSMDETNLLRRLAKLLALSDQDYVASQARHRDRLSVLSDQQR